MISMHSAQIQILPDMVRGFYHRLPDRPQRQRVAATVQDAMVACYTAAIMTACDGSLHPRARAGIQLFNEGRYFDAHEELEAAWREEKGKIRELYQGILEAAVTYLHIMRGNYAGAIKVHGRSMRWLQDWPENCRGVDIGRLRQDLDTAIAEVRALGSTGLGTFNRALLKPVVWQDGPRPFLE